MNDSIPTALCEYLDRTLAAIPTSHQAPMREEMLAHLLAVFDEECVRHHDEDAAAAAAIRRFGGAAELSVELKASYHLFGRRENLMKWLLLVLGVLVFLVGAGFVCPAAAKYIGEGEASGLSVALFILGACLSLAGIWSVVEGVKRFRVGSA